MSLTVSEIRTQSSQGQVVGLSDDQVSALLDVSQRILIGLGLNTLATDYTTIFNTAQFALFEWLVSNPTSLKSLQQGRLTEVYSLQVPAHVIVMLGPIRSVGFAELYRPGGY